MKTPIEIILEEVEEKFGLHLHEHFKHHLENEKQALMEAWQHGSIRVPKEMKHINNAQEYYNQKYNK